MTKKHKLEKFFKSIFGSHLDDESSEALPNREEIDKNMEKILKMLNSEEGGAILSDNTFDKSELASLIDDFHKGYQAVYRRYDHLMGKLKKGIRPKSSNNGSFSLDFTSSDSEDSDSGSEEFSKKNKFSKVQDGKAEHMLLEDYENLQRQLDNVMIKNDELETMTIELREKLQEQESLAAESAEKSRLFQVEIDVLKKELDVSLKKEDNVNQKMRILIEEIDSLRSENAETFSKIQEADKLLGVFQLELNQANHEMERVKSENSVLKEELERTSNQVASLNQQLISTTEEKKTLRSGNFVFLKRVQEAEKALATFRDQADQKLKLVTEELTLQRVNLSSENESLKVKLEAAAQKESEMVQRLLAAEEEISSLKSAILESSRVIQDAEKTVGDLTDELVLLRNENVKLQNINTDLNQQLEVKTLENEALASEQLKAIEVIQKAEDKTIMLSVETEALKVENSKLLVDNDRLKQDLVSTNDGVFELKSTLKTTEDEKQSLLIENAALVNKIQNFEKAIDNLKAETEQRGNDNSQLQIKINDLSLELEAVSSQISNLNKELGAAEQEKNALALELSGVLIKLQQTEASEKDLKNELENLREEKSTLQHDAAVKIQEAENIIVDLKAEVQHLIADNSELKSNVSNLNLEVEASNLQLTNLNTTLVTVEEEKKTLAVELSAAMIKLQQAESDRKELENELEHLKEENSIMHLNMAKFQEAEKIIDDLKAEVELLKADNSELKANVMNLGIELEASSLQLTDLNKLLAVAEEEKTKLASENSDVSSKLLEAEVVAEKLENDLKQMREENSLLLKDQSKLQETVVIVGELKDEIQQLRDDNSQLETKMNDLSLELESANLQLLETEVVVEKLENDLKKMREENSLLLKDRSKLLETEVIVGELKDEIEQLREDNIQLERKMNDLSLELESANLQLVDLKKVTEASEEEKASLISEIITLKGELQQAELSVQKLEAELGTLQEEHANLESNHNDLQQQKNYLEKKLEEEEEVVGKLEVSCKKLLEKLELSETSKADEARENSKLNNRVQTLEVQLRLSNQKVKITEQESKEKVEAYEQEMEEMREERREIEEQMLIISGTMNFLKNEVRKLRDGSEAAISCLSQGFPELESVFEKTSGHILNQLSTCSEEVKALKKSLTGLKNEKQELSARLKYDEEIISKMKDELRSVGDRLANKEKELAFLRADAIESEERMKVLEEMLREKKKEVSDKDEAKREAIRQLCLLIDYYRDINDHLRKHISSMIKGRGRSQ